MIKKIKQWAKGVWLAILGKQHEIIRRNTAILKEDCSIEITEY